MVKPGLLSENVSKAMVLWNETAKLLWLTGQSWHSKWADMFNVGGTLKRQTGARRMGSTQKPE